MLLLCLWSVKDVTCESLQSRWISGRSKYTWVLPLHWNPWRDEGLCLLEGGGGEPLFTKKQTIEGDWHHCVPAVKPDFHLSISFVCVCIDTLKHVISLRWYIFTLTQCLWYSIQHICILSICKTWHSNVKGRQVKIGKISIYSCMYVVKGGLHPPSAFTVCDSRAHQVTQT